MCVPRGNDPPVRGGFELPLDPVCLVRSSITIGCSKVHKRELDFCAAVFIDNKIKTQILRVISNIKKM